MDSRSTCTPGQSLGEPILLAFFSEDWDPSRPHLLERYREALQQLPGSPRLIEVSGDGTWWHVAQGDEQWRLPLRREALHGELAERFGVVGSQAIFLLDCQGRVQWQYREGYRSSGALAALTELCASAAAQPVSRRAFLLSALALSLCTVAPLRRAAAAETAGDRVSPWVRPVQLNVNGETFELVLEGRVTLLDALRERLSMTGTKKGCDHGQCGACTVLMDGRRIKSCLTLAMQAEGSTITTIEGLARDQSLHPVQAAFIEDDGFQCGYCTPGQIMSAIGCIQEGHAGSDAEIQEWMSGNICRCGAYVGIRAAIRRAADQMERQG
jgi:xanthine dehydrogenase YagT iron-sulfur-binding subunit